MKRLLDAFLELPTWQGVALIAAVVIAAMYASWRMFRAGYRLGQIDANAEQLHFRTKHREREAIRQ